MGEKILIKIKTRDKKNSQNSFIGDNFPWGNFLGDNFPWGNFPGGNIPGGIFPRTLFPVTPLCCIIEH